MYLGEPCRICGETIEDIDGVVFAGYSKDSMARSAHGECWREHGEDEHGGWAHP